MFIRSAVEWFKDMRIKGGQSNTPVIVSWAPAATQPKHWAEPPLLKSLLLGIYTNVVNGVYIGKHQQASWLRGLVACEQALLFGQAKAYKTLLDLHISS